MTYPYVAKRRVEGLIRALTQSTIAIQSRTFLDFALPVFDAVIEEIENEIGNDNPIVRSVEGVISPERAASGDLLVAEMLNAEIGSRPVQQPRRIRSSL